MFFNLLVFIRKILILKRINVFKIYTSFVSDINRI